MPLEIRGTHFFNSECTISAGNTLRIGPAIHCKMFCELDVRRKFVVTMALS